jgi:flagellar biosynthetic protein FlhB
MLQTGGIQIHPQLIGFRPDRINPLSNLKNLFSLRSASRLGKSMVPAGLLAVFAVARISHQRDMPPFSTVRLQALGTDVYQILIAASWLLFCWALIDYLVEWRSRETRLKMSRQEMRDEYKESEGNPQVRGRIRNLQRQARHRRMKADVAKAAVVVTNPTHYAVALGFDFVTMEAPKVLAKGRNLLAEEIKEQARWAGVPILENPPLARSLYRSVETGDSIPAALYAAVASILAFLYRQRMQQEIRERQQRNGPESGRSWGAESSVDAEDAAPKPIAVIPGMRRRPTKTAGGSSSRSDSSSPGAKADVEREDSSRKPLVNSQRDVGRSDTDARTTGAKEVPDSTVERKS